MTSALLLVACARDPLPFAVAPDLALHRSATDLEIAAPDLATTEDLTLAPDLDVADCRGPLLTARRPWPLLGFTSLGGLAAVDLDKDGHLDLLTSVEGPGPAVSVLAAWGKGDGTFAAATAVSTSVAAMTGSDVAAGDLDKDGRLDLVYLVASQVVVALASGARSFEAPAHYSSTGGGAFRLHVADVNEDGRLDVLIGTGKVRVDWV